MTTSLTAFSILLSLAGAPEAVMGSAFVLARSSIRITRIGGIVRVVGLDPGPMAATGLVLFPSPVAAYELAGGHAALVTGLVALTCWLGFRVTVIATATDACTSRRLLFVIPWSQRHHRGVAHAITDGWGDFADPEALKLQFAGGGPDLELAWTTRGSGSRCDELAAAFNAEVAACSRLERRRLR